MTYLSLPDSMSRSNLISHVCPLAHQSAGSSSTVISKVVGVPPSNKRNTDVGTLKTKHKVIINTYHQKRLQEKG